MSTSLPLQVRSLPRARISADEGVTGHLARLASQDLQTSERAGRVVVVRTDSVDLVALHPAILQMMTLGRFMAGLTTTVTAGGPVEAVGLVGPEREGGTRMAFLEWSDSRWWQWRGRAVGDGVQALERSAVQGDPMPDRLGRWWRLARRSNLRMSMTRTGTEQRVST